MVSDGTKLLQSALSKKSSNLNEPKSRMPLSDIKNVVHALISLIWIVFKFSTSSLRCIFSYNSLGHEFNIRVPFPFPFNQVNQDTTAQARRKKWRKSTIQLVPTLPVATSLPQNSENQRPREDVPPLRLPRAMEPLQADNDPPFGDRNSPRTSESVAAGNKEMRSMIPRRSPVRMRKASAEKENCHPRADL